MRRISFFGSFFILISQALFAQLDYNLSSPALFVPSNYYVGDMVQCRLHIEVAGDQPLVVPEKDQFPNKAGFVFTEIQILDIPDQQNSYELVIHFISFYPQQQEIPELDLGGIILKGVTVNTLSILTNDNMTLASIRPQVYLPYTREMVILLVLILLVFPICYITFSERFREYVRNRISIRSRVKPYNRINGLIRELGESAGVVTPREFYIRLSQAIRQYLSDLSGEDYISITTNEMNSRLGRFFSDSRIPDSINDIMIFSDEIKFSGKRAARSHQRRDLVRLKRAVSLIEKEMVVIRQRAQELEHKKKRSKGRVEKTGKADGGRL